MIGEIKSWVTLGGGIGKKKNRWQRQCRLKASDQSIIEREQFTGQLIFKTLIQIIIYLYTDTGMMTRRSNLPLLLLLLKETFGQYNVSGFG